MKINSINNIGFKPQKIYKNTKSSTRAQEIKQNNAEPKYFKTHNTLPFKGNDNSVVYMPKFSKEDGSVEMLYIAGQYSDTNTTLIEINNKDYEALFADKDGNPDGMVVLKFATMFKHKMMNEIIRLRKNIEFFENIVGERADIFDELNELDEFQGDDEFGEFGDFEDEDEDEFADLLKEEQIQEILQEELAKKQPNDTFVRNFISKIPDEELKEELALEILGLYKGEKLSDLTRRSKDYVLSYLYLSKTKDGFDYSNKKDKDIIIDTVGDLEDDFDTNDMLKDFLQISKRELGEINIPFIKALVLLAKNYDVMPMPLDEMGYILKKFQSKDKENSQKIANLMVAFTEKYDFDELNFETIFNFAFNPITNKYDPVAAETLMKILNETDEWIDEEMIDFDKHYAHFKDAQDEIIINYFDLAKDRVTGKIGEFAPSTSDFIENQKDRYSFKD